MPASPLVSQPPRHAPDDLSGIGAAIVRLAWLAAAVHTEAALDLASRGPAEPSAPSHAPQRGAGVGGAAR